VNTRKDPVILGDGFFRRLTIELVEPDNGDVLATVSEWRDFGSCAGVPNCPIDVSMTLRPGESAGFHVLLTTTDGKPPAHGMRGIRVALGEARRRILAADGSPWSGPSLMEAWLTAARTGACIHYTPADLAQIRLHNRVHPPP
jgi:hypothetical protein